MKRIQSGLTIVEVLLTIALFSVLLSGISQLVATGIATIDAGKFRATAAELASQGMEAMYLIRQNKGFNFSPSPASDSFITSPSEYYQPGVVAGVWQLGSKKTIQPPSPLSAPYTAFTRTVQITRVYRTATGLSCQGEIVAPGGSSCDDVNTREVTVTVSWQNKGPKQYRLVSFLTNI